MPQNVPGKEVALLQAGREIVPGYVLVKPLGQGGFGEVWQARASGGFDVALKCVRLEADGGKKGSGAELRSLKIIQGIHHPNLLTLFGAWQVGELLVIAMEKADRSLMDRLKQAQEQGHEGLEREEALDYFEQAARGIDHLNTCKEGLDGGTGGVQHRDIKPHNILLMGGGVKVADYGLARVLEHTVTSHTGSMTPAYAAPEFFEGKTSRHSDQYSLAVAYCHVRGGRLPFEGQAAQIMAGHIMHPPDLSMLPEEERPTVARALAKKPEDRWPSCREFIRTLRCSVSGTAGRAGRTQAASPALAAHRATLPELPSSLTTRRPAPEATASRSWMRPGAFLFVLFLLVAGGLGLGAAYLWSTGQLPITVAGLFIGSSRTIATDPSLPAVTSGLKDVSQTKAVDQPPPAAVLRLLPVKDVTVEAGKTQTLEVRVERQNCKGLVALDVQGLPENVTVKPLLIDADQNTTRLEIVAAPDAQPVSRPIRMRAKLGDLQTEQPLSLVITPRPVLRLLALADVTLESGQSKTITVRVERQNCKGPVQVNAQGLPSKVTAKPVLLQADQDTGRLEITAAPDADVGSKSIRVMAKLGDLQTEQQFTISLTLRPMLRLLAISDVTLEAGQSKTIDVRVERQNCKGPVRLDLQGLPSKVTAKSVTLDANQESGRLEVNAAADAEASKKSFRVTASLGELQSEQPAMMVVTIASMLRLLAIADVTIEAGQSKTIDVRVQRMKYKGPIELRVEGLPTGVQVAPALIPADREAGQLKLTVDADLAPRNHLLRLRAVAVDVRTDGEFRLLVSQRKTLNNSIGMKFVLIPLGKFQMGSPKDEEGRTDNEQQHEVEIKQAFYLGIHTVTVGQFREFVRASSYETEAEKDGLGAYYDKEKKAFFGPTWNSEKKELEGARNKYYWQDPRFEQGDNHPVVNVSWNDGVAFCEWLSKKEGKKYRLPTEAEWEYSCRAGTTTRFWCGDTDATLEKAANIADRSLKAKWNYSNLSNKEFQKLLEKWFAEVAWDDGYPFTAPVGSFKPNAFGLYDMHGNVYQWCADWYGSDYYKNSPVQDPQGPSAGGFRVFRGGSFNNIPRNCRSAHRNRGAPSYRNYGIGFRVVLVR